MMRSSFPVLAEPIPGAQPQRAAAGDADNFDIDAACPTGVVKAGPDLIPSQAGTGLSLQEVQEMAE